MLVVRSCALLLSLVSLESLQSFLLLLMLLPLLSSLLFLQPAKYASSAALRLCLTLRSRVYPVEWITLPFPFFFFFLHFLFSPPFSSFFLSLFLKHYLPFHVQFYQPFTELWPSPNLVFPLIRLIKSCALSRGSLSFFFP